MIKLDCLSLDHPERPLPTELQDAPGGFLWWYLDLLDQRGDGLVLIWSFGLPFLPGCLNSSRRGQAISPRARPSLYLATYRQGRTDLYMLQEFEPDAVSWQPERGRWQFGQTCIVYQRQAEVDRLQVELDCQLAGSSERVCGHVEVQGTACLGVTSLADELPQQAHRWTPLLSATQGVADLRWGNRPLLHLQGRAYFDRNACALPLDQLNIEHWIWGRVPGPHGERIYYLLWSKEEPSVPRCFGIDIAADGRSRLQELQVDLAAPRRGVYGMPWWQRIRLHRSLPHPTTADRQLWLDIRLRPPLDDGPFYLRCLSDVGDQHGHQAIGIAELCRPDRVDRSWMRPLVRMRVHRLAGGNSLWLPLFNGPRQGRWQRLWAYWRGITPIETSTVPSA